MASCGADKRICRAVALRLLSSRALGSLLDVSVNERFGRTPRLVSRDFEPRCFVHRPASADLWEPHRNDTTTAPRPRASPADSLTRSHGSLIRSSIRRLAMLAVRAAQKRAAFLASRNAARSVRARSPRGSRAPRTLLTRDTTRVSARHTIPYTSSCSVENDRTKGSERSGCSPLAGLAVPHSLVQRRRFAYAALRSFAFGRSFL